MKIVDGYTEGGGYKPMTARSHPHLIGKSFRSFGAIVDALKPGEAVTTEHLQGYKQVGKDTKGQGWVQRNFAPEY